MKTSREYLEEALAKLGDMSDAKKAEQLKISKAALSMYRTGNRQMDDYACIMVGRMLGIDPLEVIAAANMEREKTQERRDFWADFRQKIGIMGLAGLTLATTMTPQPVQATVKQSLITQMYIMLNMVGVWLRSRTPYFYGFTRRPA